MSKSLAQVARHVVPVLILLWLAGCSGGDGTSVGDGTPSGGGTAQGGQGTDYTIGGKVSGLSGTVMLQNNGGNDLSLSANSAFVFSTTMPTGSNYSVAVLTQPASQTCTVANGAGTVSGASVTDVSVTCSSPLPSLALFAGDTRGGIATDNAGNVYVADSSSSTIRKITPAGAVTTLAGTAGVTGSTDATGAAASFFLPGGVATDDAGNVYVADSGNRTIRKITPAGVVTTFAGTAGVMGSTNATGAAASFNFPLDVATDSAGNVYVVDPPNQTIRKITPTGAVTTLAGSGFQGSTDATGAAARFFFPQGIATDSAGNVYVGDTINETIRKITPAGVVTTLAGMAADVVETPGIAGSTDAIGSAARFNSPTGLAVDSAGNVYVADTGNHTIRKITPAGAVSTVVGVAGQAGFTPGALPGLLNGPGRVAVSGTSLYIESFLNGVAVVQNRP
jgi:sugar lactone lactonase YvrE